MPGLSLRDAGREVGVSKSTIFRAIKSGRMSAMRDDDGNFAIDPAELFRVYPPRQALERAAAMPSGQGAPSSETSETPALRAEIEGLRAQLQLMREKDDEIINELKGQRDSWQRQAESAIRIVDQRPAEVRRGWFGWRKAG